MRVGEERNRPRVLDYVRDIHVQANHYRYGTKYRIGWKSGIDPESSEVYGYQNVGKSKFGTVKHNHIHIIGYIASSEKVESRLEVSDSADGNL